MRQVEAEDRDERLMARVAEGDAVAFEALVKRNLRRALVIAQGVTGVAADADEVAQEAFMRVWRHADRWDPAKARFSTWLYRIVVNLCLDRRRKSVAVPLDDTFDMQDDGPTAADRVAERQEQDLVARVLTEIPARQRAAIALFYFDGMNGKDAAQAMGVTIAAFEQLLFRARRAVKEKLEGYGIDSWEGGLS